MALKPEVSIGMGVAVAALVYGVYSNITPGMADIRAAQPGNGDVEGTRKQAAWMSAAVVSGVSLIAKDPTVFVIGGSMVIMLDWFTRHANEVDPRTGRAAVMPETDDGMADMGDSDDQAAAYAS